MIEYKHLFSYSFTITSLHDHSFAIHFQKWQCRITGIRCLLALVGGWVDASPTPAGGESTLSGRILSRLNALGTLLQRTIST
jgi:hypothetical protein